MTKAEALEIGSRLATRYSIESGWVLVKPSTVPPESEGFVVHTPDYPIKGYEYRGKKVWYIEHSTVSSEAGDLHAVRVNNIYASVWCP